MVPGFGENPVFTNSNFAYIERNYNDLNHDVVSKERVLYEYVRHYGISHVDVLDILLRKNGQNWHASFHEICRLMPDCATAPSHDGSYVLHYACANNTPFDIFVKIIDANPSAIEKANNHGYYPLHLACKHQRQSQAVIELLISMYPDAVQKQTTDNGDYPLHLACKGDSILSSTVECLVSKWPEGLTTKNYYGQSPLDYAENPHLHKELQDDIIQWFKEKINIKSCIFDQQNTSLVGEVPNCEKIENEDVPPLNKVDSLVASMEQKFGSLRPFEKVFPILKDIDTKFNCRIPKLFVVVPIQRARIKKVLWFHCTMLTKIYHVYFVCAESFEFIEPPIVVRTTDDWTANIAPIYAASIHMLSLALNETTATIDISDYDKYNDHIKYCTRIENLLLYIHAGYENDTNLTLRRCFARNDIARNLNKNAYDEITKLACKQNKWKENMKQLKNINLDTTFWVAKDSTLGPNDGYEEII